ncbi:MAG: DUF2147 domain-containing protein [Deltaproteobacteria bacterium]|nr:DUF2147 domain-containing protein [Deltaproteobacteria bacterium]MBW1930740.1 DUF2147 domain-containing protein [Deltaproteobacteria bacterium]MBW2024533.1 DUF2147 domain-containing protein [Deltaproteobacteria bacterium]MBW2125743.1 DUF2147 domain-containing protein [Deltaproteobacteria bacterium]
MRWFGMIVALVVICSLLIAPITLNAASEEQGDAILGKWLTAGGKSLVEIYKCGDGYCGKIVWLREPFDKEGKEKLDVHNTDESKRNRKLLGLQIINGFKHKGDNRWEGGKIYDPEKGKTYKCKARLEGDNLKLRGYIGFSLIGRTTTWRRK